MRTLVLLLTGITSFSSAVMAECELTDEYKQARTLYVREARQAYNECVSSVTNADYWYKYVQCIEAGDGKAVGGGCAHLATTSGEKYQSLDIDTDFCTPLKPTVRFLKTGFEQYMQAYNVAMCK
ncbi:hypothetical protein [Spongorhabdus nitratireducens]